MNIIATSRKISEGLYAGSFTDINFVQHDTIWHYSAYGMYLPNPCMFGYMCMQKLDL